MSLKDSFGTKLALVALAVLLVDFAVFWGWHGGWVNYDTQVQWEQAASGAYTNWHPFVHTFLMMKLPSLVWNDYRAAVLWQVLLFSGVFGYAAEMCLRCGFQKKHVAIAAICVLLHPQTLFFLMTPLKDTAFAIAVLLAMVPLVDICRTRGAAMRERSVWMPLAAGLALAALFRHNGIFFSGSAILLLTILHVRRRGRHVLACVLATILIYGGCRWGLGGLLDVQPASRHAKQYAFIESAGLPLTLMGAVYVRHVDKVPADARAILESIRPQKVWQERYQDGSFNVVKHAGISALPEETIGGIRFDGWREFADACWRTISIDPRAAARAFVLLTDQVWSPFGGVREDSLRFPLRKIGVKGDLSPWLKILHVVAVPLLGICACVSWCLVAASLYSVWRRRWDVLLVTVPILCYNFGTMLFLSGFNMMRLFYCDVLVAGVLALCWLSRKREPDTTGASA